MVLYKVEMEGLHEIEQDLGKLKDKSKMVLRNAINSTAKEVMKMLPKLAASDYYVTQPAAKHTLKIDKATVGNLTATVRSNGHALELYDTKVRPKGYNPHNRPKAGHTGNVKRVNPPEYLHRYRSGRDQYKAFVVQFQNKHKSIVERIPGKRTYKRKGVDKRTGKPYEYMDEALQNLYTISIPQMLYKAISEEELHAATHAEIEALLTKHVQEQIKRYLK